MAQETSKDVLSEFLCTSNAPGRRSTTSSKKKSWSSITKSSKSNSHGMTKKKMKVKSSLKLKKTIEKKERPISKEKIIIDNDFDDKEDEKMEFESNKIEIKTKMDENEKNNDKSAKKGFKPLNSKQMRVGAKGYRRIKVPGHRMMHIRRLWKSMCDPIVKQLKLQIRMNSRTNLIELRVCMHSLSFQSILPPYPSISHFLQRFPILFRFLLIPPHMLFSTFHFLPRWLMPLIFFLLLLWLLPIPFQF